LLDKVCLISIFIIDSVLTAVKSYIYPAKNQNNNSSVRSFFKDAKYRRKLLENQVSVAISRN